MKSQKLFYMAPEWQKKERTFIQWPARSSIWNDIFEAEMAYAKVANVISEFENVSIIINEGDEKVTEKLLSSQIEIIKIPHDDSWFRDNGPTFVFDNKKLKGICWRFNAWGEKFFPYDRDAKVAGTLLSYLNIEMICVDIVMEGGSFHVDGRGTLLTTKECLLNPNRNKNLTQEEIAKRLSTYLGVDNFIWLNKGIFGDEDTDGHVDNVACFVNERMILIQSCNDKDDPNYERYIENLNILKGSFDATGKKYEIVEIEQPSSRYLNSKRLALSYINYYPVNGGIILPVFSGDSKKRDENAVARLKEYYPGKKIVPVDGSTIITGGGNIHCITQQMPFSDQWLVVRE